MPFYVSVIFILTAFLTLILFYNAIRHTGNAATVTGILALWLALQSILTLTGVYENTTALPPRIFLLGVLPMLLVILLLFITQAGRAFTNSLKLQHLTWIHIVRIPVEIVLWQLYIHGSIPQLMTFEGRNFDILAGLTAPLIAWCIAKGKIGRGSILAWNIICLALLMNIVVNAFLSAPSPLQQLAFDRPNIAILHFPFSLLPVFIVPVVLFSHLASIRILLIRK